MAWEVTEVVDRLRRAYGDDLRAVATYDSEGFELHHIGEVAAMNYTAEDREAIHEDVILQEIERPVHEQLFEDVGAMKGKVRLFEDGFAVYLWPTDGERGLFIGFDGTADPGLRSLLDLIEADGG